MVLGCLGQQQRMLEYVYHILENTSGRESPGLQKGGEYFKSRKDWKEAASFV